MLASDSYKIASLNVFLLLVKRLSYAKLKGHYHTKYKIYARWELMHYQANLHLFSSW